ncbi:hypothetical protein MASR2M15_09460 [Anaerolineales bacterium]
MQRADLRNIILIWLSWLIIVIGFMNLIPYRLQPDRPDHALVWTATETTERSNINKPYLLDPFLNANVAWDSEFYLSITTVNYQDPAVAYIITPGRSVSYAEYIESGNEGYATSNAFFPLYPYLAKVLALPLSILGLTPIATSTLAALIVSLLGTLIGMLAIYDICYERMGSKGALLSAFMMLIFPTSFFFATVYTEGLFAGLSFASLALMRRNKLIPAALLAVLATWTRAIGGLLIIPLLLSALVMLWQNRQGTLTISKKRLWLQLPFILAPLLAYAIYRVAFGQAFDFVQSHWFGNAILEVAKSITAWDQILQRAQEVPETAVMVALAISTIMIASLSLLYTFRFYPRVALFSFFALFIPLTSGATGPHSIIRYVLVMPSLWIMLGALSHRWIVFEKAWTLLSLLLMAILAYLFSVDMWVA